LKDAQEAWGTGISKKDRGDDVDYKRAAKDPNHDCCCVANSTGQPKDQNLWFDSKMPFM
jgi:hypothetical protein